MRKIKERDIRGLTAFCLITACAADVLCVLYLLDLVQYHWFLNFIEVLSVLLHIALTLLGLIRKKPVLTFLYAVLALGYIGVLIWGNL